MEETSDARLWGLIEDGSPREPLLSVGEARAAVVLLLRQGSEAAEHLAGMLARRLPDEG